MEIPECPGCRERDRRIAELEARVLVLETQLRDLLDKLKPPTPQSPKPLPPGPGKRPTGKTPGGQPGHPPHLKSWLPPERLSRVVTHVPTQCVKCTAALPASPQSCDPPPTRHQIAELPPNFAEVTEHQGHTRICPGCGTVNTQVIPAAVRASTIGPRLLGFMSYLVGVQGVSKRSVEEILETAAGVPIALGTIAHAEREVCEALATPYQEARQAVADADVKGVDETGWKEGGKKRWLWVAATMTAVVFRIHPRRSIEALKLLLGHLDGLFQSDRWSVYLEHLPSHRHQLCWAHLKRNWEKKAERSAKAKRLAERWLALHERVFTLWHRFKNGEFDRESLQRRMGPAMAALTALYDEGSRSRDAVLARFCMRLGEAVERHWLFVLEDGVEPTNNQAERVQRRAVLWRRRSFGCRSAEGCRFVERLLTVVETLKLQKQNVLDYLEQAIAAHRRHQPCPQLLSVNG